MLNFFQLMAKHQGVVKQAQSEIDIITRQERLPTLDDRKNIPFIDCIMREVFRCVLVLSALSLYSICMSLGQRTCSGPFKCV